MIKKISINKFVVSTLSLVLMLLFYYFPVSESVEYEINIDPVKSSAKEVVYLLDNDNYLSKLNVYLDNNDIKELVINKIMLLRDGTSDYDKFNTLIPSNTEVLDVLIDKNNIYIDFSKELLDVSELLEEKMIEAIVFSITEINGINDVYIKVEGNLLESLPNSHKKLYYPLTRKYGINKEYDLMNLNNINKTTVFFIKEIDDFNYYVPVTKVSNSDYEKIDIIISELKSSVNYQSDLISYLSNNAKVNNYDITENTMNIIFNEYIFENPDSLNILEEVKYTIGLSVLENYDVDKVVFGSTSNSNVTSFSE